MILHRILAHKKSEIAANKTVHPLSWLREKGATARVKRSLSHALKASAYQPALIAEVKRKSPSKGVIRADFDPVAIASAYATVGAAAISVLTDQRFFGGRLDYLSLLCEVVEQPLLRKDFVIDPYQVYEAWAFGADAILLIVAALDQDQLLDLLQLTTELGMEALVEVHTAQEVERAVAAGASIIGINNRDLSTFTTSLEVTQRLAPLIPAGTKIVSESGIHSPQDLGWVARVGVDAVLVGEALMRQEDPAAAARALYENGQKACL